MKLVCQQADLSANLSLVSRAVPSRPERPVLANVLLTVDAGTQRASLTGFDLSLGIQTSFAAKVETSGAIALPAKLLTDIVSKLPSDSELVLEGDETTHQVTLSSNSGHYEVRGMDAAEFPELPLVVTGDATQLPLDALGEGLQGTLFATSPDETKQVLTGVHLKMGAESLEFAATDGHRLAVVEVANATSRAETEFLEVTLPGRALRDLERMLSTRAVDDAVALYFDQGQTVFQWGDQYLTSRTLEGAYPNYQQLIPRQFSQQMTIDRKLFLAALERIAVLADQKNNVVKLELDVAQQQVCLSVEAQDVGSGREVVPAQISGDGLEAAFNVRYLTDGLKALTSTEVQMQMNTPTSPSVLIPLGATKMTYLVMPVQIRS